MRLWLVRRDPGMRRLKIPKWASTEGVLVCALYRVQITLLQLCESQPIQIVSNLEFTTCSVTVSLSPRSG